MIKKLLILLVLIIISCNNKEQRFEIELKNCVNQGLKESRPESEDFYDLMTSLENRMIEKGLLKSKKKRDYLLLLKSIEDKSKGTKDFYFENIKYLNDNFPFNLFLANDLIFNQCPFKVYSKNEKENAKIYNIGKLQNQIMESGFINVELNEKLINNLQDTDFEKIVYRAPIIQLILINLDLKFNPELEKFEKSRKNRTFSNKN